MSHDLSESAGKNPWWAGRPWQQWGLWFLAALAVFEGFWTVFCRDNDFLWHRNQAECFLQGRPTADHYLPARFFMDVPLALCPYLPVRAICYCLALGMLLICCRRWSDLAARSAPWVARAACPAAILTVLLLLPYVIRDLDECGLQIALLFLLTMGGWAVSRGKGLQAGFWLGSAACYKVTPMLFLPFLLWKRQWRAAASMAVFFLLWCAVPALYTGWDKNVEAHRRWYAGVQHIKAARQAYPSLLEKEPPKINNMSLLAGIARFLETYPPGHALYVDHPLFLQFGNLSSEAAYLALHGILVLLGLWFAWKTRRPWREEKAGAGFAGSFAGEWAAVCLLCALLSPLCWKQHVVLILPCMFLVVSQVIGSSGRRVRGLVMVGICSALLCLFPGPDIFGGDVSAVLHSYKLHTLGAVLVMIWALLLPREGAAVGCQALPTDGASLPRAA